MRRWEAKQHQLLSLSCTVYDTATTLVRCQSHDGEYLFWSSVNFNHLRSLLDFEVGGFYYTILMGIGDGSTAAAVEWNAAIVADEELRNHVDLRYPVPPAAIARAAGRHSTYQIVESPNAGINPQL